MGIELIKAALAGDAEKVRTVLSSGVPVDQLDSSGRTALHAASWKGHTEVVKILLDRGANIQAIDPRGGTPLHLAAMGGHLDTVELLVRHGANLDAKTTYGATPEYSAAEEGHTSVAQFLRTCMEKSAKLKSGPTRNFWNRFWSLLRGKSIGERIAVEYRQRMSQELADIHERSTRIGRTATMQALMPQLIELCTDKVIDDLASAYQLTREQIVQALVENPEHGKQESG